MKMLLSERTPGYRNKSHVPPIRSRRSTIVLSQARVALSESIGCIEARDAGADDNHVDVADFGFLAESR